MRSRHDTGLCRICCYRKNLNKHDRIVRHNHLMRRCDGSMLAPGPGSIVRANSGPYTHKPESQDEDTLASRIRYMESIIAAGIPATSEDMLRARRTLENLKQQETAVIRENV